MNVQLSSADGLYCLSDPFINAGLRSRNTQSTVGMSHIYHDDSPLLGSFAENISNERKQPKIQFSGLYSISDVLQPEYGLLSNHGSRNKSSSKYNFQESHQQNKQTNSHRLNVADLNSAKYQSTPQTNQRSSSSNGDVSCKSGEKIGGRYVVDCQLGKGSFGQVFKCFDSFTNNTVAIKIIKNKKAFYEQGKLELQLLHYINKCDIHKKYIVLCLNYFTWTNHLCLVFELLGSNLYELLKRGGFRGLPLKAVRSISLQLLEVLSFLKTLGIIHCDLKPENILLINEKCFRVKVADMGSSCYLNSKPYKYIQSRFYRSPEVIMELGYDHAIDMWSLGCIMAELYTGEALFRGSNEMDQLSCMIEVLGYFPSPMIQYSSKSSNFFVYDPAKDHYILKNSSLIKVYRPVFSKPIHVVLSKGIENSPMSSECKIFMNLLTQTLTYQPTERVNPDSAMCHPFFESIASSNSDQSSTNNYSPNPAAIPTATFGYQSLISNANKECTKRSQKSASSFLSSCPSTSCNFRSEYPVDMNEESDSLDTRSGLSWNKPVSTYLHHPYQYYEDSSSMCMREQPIVYSSAIMQFDHHMSKLPVGYSGTDESDNYKHNPASETAFRTKQNNDLVAPSMLAAAGTVCGSVVSSKCNERKTTKQRKAESIIAKRDHHRVVPFSKPSREYVPSNSLCFVSNTNSRNGRYFGHPSSVPLNVNQNFINPVCSMMNTRLPCAMNYIQPSSLPPSQASYMRLNSGGGVPEEKTFSLMDTYRLNFPSQNVPFVGDSANFCNYSHLSNIFRSESNSLNRKNQIW